MISHFPAFDIRRDPQRIHGGTGAGHPQRNESFPSYATTSPKQACSFARGARGHARPYAQRGQCYRTSRCRQKRTCDCSSSGSRLSRSRTSLTGEKQVIDRGPCQQNFGACSPRTNATASACIASALSHVAQRFWKRSSEPPNTLVSNNSGGPRRDMQ
jgi:hypothetical protein